MSAPFPKVILQMCNKYFFSSLQILGGLPLHCLPPILIWVHYETATPMIVGIKKGEVQQLCKLNKYTKT